MLFKTASKSNNREDPASPKSPSASRLPFVHVADAPVQATYTTEELAAWSVCRPARAASISSAS
jgi:hypothetical protein